jgi:hypothetical protein
MKKSTLETFIKKYNLNGNVESVKLVVDDTDKKLRTAAITDDKNLLIDVVLSDVSGIDASQIGIYDTAQLKQMLSVLGEDINIKINNKADKVMSLTISDDTTEIQYVTADLDIIAVSPALKKLPDFNVEIDFTSDFISKFIKAKNALSDIDTFTLMMNKKKKLEMAIGHSKINSNKITLNVVTKNDKDTVANPISFSAKYLKEILTSNSDCDGAVLKVSDSGLANISFTKDNFASNYYLIEIKNVD